MDELKFGKRNKRGDFLPHATLKIAPFLVFPLRPVAILKWLPGYFLPWNALFMALATIFWLYLTPAVETMRTLAPGWIAYLLVRNSILVFLFYGALELRLYIKRSQGGRFKYNGKFPAENPNDFFLFKSQNIDNIIRTFATGVPIWTAYEVM